MALLERSNEKQKYVYVYFIDGSKTFSTVKHEPLVQLLEILDTGINDIRLFSYIYWNQQIVVRHN